MPTSLNTGDTVFLMMCSAMVLLMTPALAFFYGGLVRRKDILSIMMQTFICIGLVTIIWVFGGFSLAFGPDLGGVIGNPFTYFGMHNVGGAPNPDYADTIPFIIFFAYQMMFAIITPGLITGSFVSRFKIAPYMIFVILWTVLIYTPVAHWMWGGGWLSKMGAVDFAGGIVVHTTAGLSALTTAKYLGSRRGENRSNIAANIPLVAIGAGLLWFGWFGFNSGGAYKADELAAYAFVNTTLAGSVALLVWLFWQWRDSKKPSFSGILVGSVTGLATITPAAGYVEPWAALIIGAVGATACYFARTIQRSLHIDDALEVFRAHGTGGMVGTLMIGFLARQGIDAVSASTSQLLVQLLAIVAVGAYSIVITWLIMTILNAKHQLRISTDEETQGLDFEMGEEAYHL